MAMKRFSVVFSGALTALLFSTSAWAQMTAQPTLEEYSSRTTVATVPSGNRNALMPRPVGTKIYKDYDKTSKTALPEEIADAQVKYNRVLQTLKKNNGDVVRLINRVAPIYDVPPIHVLGAIIGEHTFNVDVFDNAQSYVVVMLGKWTKAFDGNRLSVAELLEQKELRQCDMRTSTFELWNCVGYVWEKEFRGQTKNGKTWNNGSLMMTFFNPTGAGKTYGLGQMGPLRVLMATDIVNKRAGFKKLTAYDAQEVYEALLDPEKTVHYIAANISLSIHYYKTVAGFDISDNPGVTATLYNLGNEKNRANALYKANLQRLKAGDNVEFPQESHYGWWINDKRAELEALLAKFPAK